MSVVKSGGRYWDDQDLAEKARESGRKAQVRADLGASMGQRVIDSPEFKKVAFGRLPSDNAPLVEGETRLAGFTASEVKTLIRSGSSTSAGAFLSSESVAPAPVPARPLKVLDLVRSGEMTQDAVTFARQDAFASVTAATAEATSTVTGTKPEATIALSVVTATAATYASWAPVTRRALSDTSEVRTLVDARLLQDARQQLETALLASVNTDAGQSQAKSTDGTFSRY